MAYIGNTPADKYQTLEKQSFTTSATTGYTLSYSVSSPQDIALFINNVRQNPNSSYTVSNTALTLSSATSSSDVMYAVFLGKSVGTVGVPVNGVGTSQIIDANITTAKIADSAVTSAKLASGLLPTNTPAFGAKRSNAQTASQDTWTKVDFDTEIYDSDGKFDISTDRFTPTVAGTYIIYGQLANNNLYNQAYLQVAIYKNGSLLIESEIIGNNSTSNRNYTVNVTAIDVADTDDYYELYGKQGLGAGVPITEASRNIFMGYKLA